METPESVIEAPPKPLSESESFSEFKKAKAGKVPATVEEQPPAEDKPEATSESAAASETAETTPQEKPVETPEKRDKTLEGRIKELRSKGRHGEANKLMVDAAVKAEKERADKAEKELQDFRTRKPAEPSSAVTPPPARAVQPSDDAAPKQEDYDGTAGKTYQDYLVDLIAHRLRQDRRKEEQAQRQATIRDTVNRKLADARSEHADFDAVTARDAFVITPAMQQFAVEHDLGFEVLYKLAATPAEYKRIFALAPILQLGELGAMARELTAPPEKPKPPVSRVPPPPPKGGGTEQAPPKSTHEATSFGEFKRIKRDRK